MAIFVTDAPSAVAVAIKETGVWVAWGRGSDSWDMAPEPEPADAGSLVDEIGRRRAQVIQFVTPDPAGDIIVPQGAFAIHPEPTGNLYVRCNFANTDGVGESLREGGVFIGTALVAGLPAGQEYFTPGNIASIGRMLMLERFAKITRSVDFGVSLEFVVSF